MQKEREKPLAFHRCQLNDEGLFLGVPPTSTRSFRRYQIRRTTLGVATVVVATKLEPMSTFCAAAVDIRHLLDKCNFNGVTVVLDVIGTCQGQGHIH